MEKGRQQCRSFLLVGMRTIEEAGLVRRERRGREHIFDLDARPLREIYSFASRYERFWNERVDRLERHFKKEKS